MQFKENDLVMIDLGTMESENGQGVPAQELGVVRKVDSSDGTYLVAPLRDLDDTGWLTVDEVRRPTRMEVLTCDPDSPLAVYLVGKSVLYGDVVSSLFYEDCSCTIVLEGIKKEARYPFRCRDVGFVMVAAPLPPEEPETIDVTMADVCAKFDGKNVRIRKE